MRLSKQKIFATSIDWYMEVNGRWVQGISLGGMFPEQVNDALYLPLFQALCSIMPDNIPQEQVAINETLIRQRYNRHIELAHSINRISGSLVFAEEDLEYDNFKNRYSELFIRAAQKGFYSYARINIDDPHDHTYMLIASPTEDSANKLVDNMQRKLSDAIYIEIKQYLNSIKITNTHIPAPSFAEALRL